MFVYLIFIKMVSILKKIFSYRYLIIFILIFIDQLSKLLILFLYNKKSLYKSNFFEIGKNFNDKYSWINSLFDLNLSLIFHIILTIFLFINIIYFFKYIYNKYNLYVCNDLILINIFLTSGCICSIIDKIFWKGSLDFFIIKNLFSFDLKDVYLTLFQFLIIINIKKISNLNIKKIFLEYIKYLKRLIKI